MKLGCCLNMLGDRNDSIGRSYIYELQRAGYDYMELPLAQIMELSEPEFEKLAVEIETSGIPCQCCNNFFPASVRLTGQEADLVTIKKYIKSAMDRAAALGVKVIVFGSSGAKNVPEGFPHNLACDQLVNILRIAEAYGVAAGIHIAIEPLNHMESNIINNLEEGRFLMKKTDSAFVGLLVDYYHFTMEKENLDVLKELTQALVHVHFAEPSGRVFPSEHHMKYKEFFKVLRENGYDGRVSIEAYARHPKEALMKAIFIRRYF